MWWDDFFLKICDFFTKNREKIKKQARTKLEHTCERFILSEGTCVIEISRLAEDWDWKRVDFRKKRQKIVIFSRKIAKKFKNKLELSRNIYVRELHYRREDE